MANLEFSFFCNILERGVNGILPIDGTHFIFDDDPKKVICDIYYFENIKELYCGGDCCSPKKEAIFYSVTEMVNYPLFNGKSMKDRWDHIIVHHIGGYPTRDWLASWTNWPKEKIAQVYQYDAYDILKLFDAGVFKSHDDLSRYEIGRLIAEMHSSTDLDMLRRLSQILELDLTEWDLKRRQRNNTI